MESKAIFSRERLAGYNPEVLHPAKVCIVGLGALGENLALNLALSGIGELRLVDFDEFEGHNRTRSPLFPTPAEAGRFGLNKAVVSAHKLLPMMTAPQPVIRFAATAIQQLAAGAFEGVDVVVSCVDSVSARCYLADQCRLLGIAFVEAGFKGPILSLSCFPPATTETAFSAPCYRCSNPNMLSATSCELYAREAEQQGIIPAIQNGAAALAGLQAEAVIQALHGKYPLGNKRIFLNLNTGESKMIHLATASNCYGEHKRIQIVEPLQTPAHAPAGLLLEELAERDGQAPQIWLSETSTWILADSCKVCGKFVDVQASQWSWLMDPRCQECGGRFPRSQEEWIALAAQPILGCNSPAEMLTLSNATLGLSPLSVVTTFAADQPERYWRMPGTLGDLYTTLTPQEE
jgi:molybdopterin/thiamine biosynthesis adenylyltransferase